MLVTVLAVSVIDDRPIVECRSPTGLLGGVWRADFRPVPGQSYIVEVNVPGTVAWGKELAVDVATSTGQRNALVGQIEAIEGDTLTVRVDESVVLLDVEGDGPAAQIGLTVLLRPGALEFYPTGI